MGDPVLQIDIAIIGGGIAGLWALNQLRDRGYSAALFEHRALGGDQTAASQGIIHGGIKYTLSGQAHDRSGTLAAMPGAWRDCLAGRGRIDLRDCRVLSEQIFLWSNTPFTPALRAALASAPPPQELPGPLQAAQFRGHACAVDEPVLDIPSLVHALATRQRQAIFRIDWRHAALQQARGRARLLLPNCIVEPQRLVLAAGAGNAALIEQLGGTAPAMQRRPLQQVLVKHEYRGAFFAHCVGSKPSPLLTVTSHRSRSGAPLWSLGGELATEGAPLQPAQRIARAKQVLAELLPWLDLGRTQWRTLTLDRAEPRLPGDARADHAFVARVEGVDNVLVGWPVKLCLCPDMGDRVLRALLAQDVLPRHGGDLTALHGLGQPPLAPPCWDALFP